MTGPLCTPIPMRNAAARVLAVAAVHERLYTDDDIRIVSLDAFLRDLCGEVGRALGCTDGIQVDFGAFDVPADMAVPLALIVSELVTNAIKYGAPPYRIATRRAGPDTLVLSVSDAGQGPTNDGSRVGMGSRIMQAFATQLGARIATNRRHDSYTVDLTIPYAVKAMTNESYDR